MKLKTESKVMRLVRRWVYRMVGIRSGLAMLQVQGEWLYVAPDGGVWRVIPTHDPYSPLMIMRERY